MLYAMHTLKKQLKPGDVFLVHGNHLLSRIIRIVTDSHWNHATLYMGQGRLIEANVHGVGIRPIEVYAHKDIEVYRHNRITDKHRSKIVYHAMKKIGKDYDFLQIIQLLFYFLFNIRGNARKIGTANRYICSELVAESYLHAGLRVYKNYNPTKISPADFSESTCFKLCVQRKNVLLLR